MVARLLPPDFGYCTHSLTHSLTHQKCADPYTPVPMEVAAVTFNISNPTLRKGTLLKFTSYDVSSTVTHSDTCSMSENFVQRRYSDFLWLHEALRERNSGK